MVESHQYTGGILADLCWRVPGNLGHTEFPHLNNEINKTNEIKKLTESKIKEN